MGANTSFINDTSPADKLLIKAVAFCNTLSSLMNVSQFSYTV